MAWVLAIPLYCLRACAAGSQDGGPFSLFVRLRSWYGRSAPSWVLLPYLFSSIEEVQDHATKWLWTYNNERPNTGIGGITPMQKLTTVA